MVCVLCFEDYSEFLICMSSPSVIPRDDWSWGGNYPVVTGVIPFWEQRNAAVVVRVLRKEERKEEKVNHRRHLYLIGDKILACGGCSRGAAGLAWLGLAINYPSYLIQSTEYVSKVVQKW